MVITPDLLTSLLRGAPLNPLRAHYLRERGRLLRMGEPATLFEPPEVSIPVEWQTSSDVEDLGQWSGRGYLIARMLEGEQAIWEIKLAIYPDGMEGSIEAAEKAWSKFDEERFIGTFHQGTLSNLVEWFPSPSLTRDKEKVVTSRQCKWEWPKFEAPSVSAVSEGA
jgi:hypothetical protein